MKHEHYRYNCMLFSIFVKPHTVQLYTKFVYDGIVDLKEFTAFQQSIMLQDSIIFGNSDGFFYVATWHESGIHKHSHIDTKSSYQYSSTQNMFAPCII